MRLPTTLRPVHYDLVVRTDLHPAKLVFDGVVKIELVALETTSMVVLNAAASLTLGTAVVVSTAVEHTPEQYDVYRSYDTSLERVTLHFARALEVGSTVVLSVKFSGKLVSSMSGLYYSTYRDVDGEPVHYSATMFQPLDARKVFPCWDEPALKSTFSISLISRRHLINISNMPALYEGPLDNSLASSLGIPPSDQVSGWKITRFDKTPPMSTYLAAWGTGPFEYRQSSYTSPLSGKTRPLRMYATPDLVGQVGHALEVTAKVLPEYEKMFDVEFPLPKLDTLLTRESTGGMENWGLVIGSAAAYAVDPARPSISQFIAIGWMQSHEIAHQWFGNITTMEWWDNLYLNEGFATWAGDYALGCVWPEYQMDTSFVDRVLNPALDLDAKLSTHPIEVEIPHEGMVAQVFDALSYQKAGSVIRMCAAHVGTDVFLRGVSAYLKRHLYGNTTSQDLWLALSEASGFDVADLLKEWMCEPGFPVLTVEDAGTGVRIRQNRFWERGWLDVEYDTVIWKVPLAVKMKNGPDDDVLERSYVLTGRESTLKLDTSKPFKLNTGTTGVYRVLYSETLFRRMVNEAVNPHTIFTAEDRVGFLLDTFAFAKAGQTKTSSLLALIDALRSDHDYFVLNAVASSLTSMRLLWRDHANIVVGLKLLQQNIFGPHVEHLGYDARRGEMPLDDLLRSIAVEQAASGGEPKVVAELMRRFESAREIASEKDIPPGLVSVTYRTAVQYGGRKTFEAVKRIYGHSQDPGIRTRCLAALGASPHLDLIVETFRNAYGSMAIPELMSALQSLAQHGQGRFVADFFKAHVDELIRDVPMAIKYFVMAFETFNKSKDYEEIKAYFEGKDTTAYDLGLSQALEQILGNVHWITHATDDVESWLEGQRSLR